jgi:hypothetical protein
MREEVNVTDVNIDGRTMIYTSSSTMVTTTVASKTSGGVNVLFGRIWMVLCTCSTLTVLSGMRALSCPLQ